MLLPMSMQAQIKQWAVRATGCEASSNSLKSPVTTNAVCSPMSTALSPIRSMQRPTSIMCIAHSRLSGVVAELERVVEDVAVELVDHVVLANQVLRHVHVAALEGLPALDHLLARLLAHPLDEVEHLLVRRRLVAVQRHELRHVHALVAHPLDVLDHVQQRGHDAQVAGHRRLKREQRQDPLVDLEIAAVDPVVVGDHHARRAPRPGS